MPIRLSAPHAGAGGFRLERELIGKLRRMNAQGPAWKRATKGETRWAASTAVVIAVLLQFTLPTAQTLGPRWLLSGFAIALLIALLVANPKALNKVEPLARTASLALIAVVAVANAWAAARLIHGLVNGTTDNEPAHLLLNGASIWFTNVIVFALGYWEFDRGGPVARALALKPYPDFSFPQMQDPEVASPHWEPGFVDYFYLSFTNATAFSPTDVMPLSRWAKLMMLVQSAIALSTLALVIARAVNIFK